MARRIEAATSPSPPSGTPLPAVATTIHRKNQQTFPSAGPEHRDRLNSTAAAEITAMTGSVIRTIGSSSATGSTAVDSRPAPPEHQRGHRETPVIEARTQELLSSLPVGRRSWSNGVVARICPTLVRWSLTMAPRTT